MPEKYCPVHLGIRTTWYCPLWWGLHISSRLAAIPVPEAPDCSLSGVHASSRGYSSVVLGFPGGTIET
uniref:Uncharacterized protein n=1 Tax=Hyaloperonospora arabidopsidis (strain Emoy2) TaxID=559515 RepID=M4BG42_HYAAE